jgi:2-polyprenyl-6-methoxyphenol hydroxylase-like FAD-dependent oxidoreductase
MDATETQALVVGAGPTGLLLAAELKRREVDCVLIDALDAPRGWDRATVVHERSLEIFESLGIVEPFLEEGVRTRGARFHSDGEAIAEIDFGATGGRYDFQVGVSEEFTEAELTRYLEAMGGAVTRSTRLVDLEQGGDSVIATVERDGDRSRIAAAWVVGCDGHHSFVRDEVGIEFEGTDINAPWAVFDATVENWSDAHDLVLVYMDQPPLILTPLPRDRWRAYVRPTDDSADLVAEAARVLARTEPAAAFAHVENPARFRCHSRVASRYRAGRVLLAGDAAHACSPNEGHGMNTGLQDAFNLGWKLAMVCRGEAGDALLDTYETERRPIAELVVATGTDVESAHALTDPADRAARDAGIRAAMADPEVVHHEAAAAAEIDRVYSFSRAVGGDDAGGALSPGRLVPDTADGIHELTHRAGHTLLVLGASAETDRIAALAAELERCSAPAVGAVIGVPIDAAAELGVTGVTVLAVRPDRYIGFRDDSGDPARVVAWLEALVAP